MMALKDFFPHSVSNAISNIEPDQLKLKAVVDAIDSVLILARDSGEIIMSNSKVEKMFSLSTPARNISDIQNVLGQDYNLQSKFFSSIYQRKPVSDSNVSWQQKYLKIDITSVESVGHLIVITDQTEEKVLDRARDEFFSIASHELRTPLTIIKGNSSMLVDLLTESRVNENQIKIAKDILLSSDRLINIINNLLQISELEHKRVAFSTINFDIKATIDSVLADLDLVLKSKKITTAVIINTDKLNILADEAKVKQIVSHLLQNSINYTKDGKITISVSKVMDMAEISVTDTGSGIPPELQNLLFRKFQQAGESLYARSGEGVGLGLYICKLLIEQMGGKIRLLNSAPNVGTTFSFTLPLPS